MSLLLALQSAQQPQLFTLQLTGAVGPAGALQRLTMLARSGVLTSTGTVTKVSIREFAGSVGPSGSPLRQDSKILSGTVAPTSILTSSKLAVRQLSGSIAPSSVLTKTSAHPVSGSVAPSGVLQFAAVFLRSLSGSIGPSGSLHSQSALRFLGSIAPSGQIVSTISKLVSGGILPAGLVHTLAQRLLSGAIAPSGAVALLKAYTVQLSGGTAPSGSASLLVAKLVSGTVQPSGVLTRSGSLSLSGSIQPSGVVVRGALYKIGLAGSVDPAGSLASSIFVPQLFSLDLAGSIAPTGNLTVTFIESHPFEPGAGRQRRPGRRRGGIGYDTRITNEPIPRAPVVHLLWLRGQIRPSGTITRLSYKSWGGGIRPIGTVTGSLLPSVLIPEPQVQVRVLHLGGQIYPAGELGLAVDPWLPKLIAMDDRDIEDLITWGLL